jgi:hypothetical protein
VFDPPPVIVIDERDHEFGIVRVGNDGNWSLDIGNSGFQDLVIGQVDVEGDDFSTDFDGELIIPGGENGTLVVTFAPQGSGEFAGSIAIHSNDPERVDDPITVSLSGVGILAEIFVDQEEVEFGNIIFGETRQATLTIGNSGDADLTVSDLQIEGDEFTSDWDGETFVLQPEQATEIVLTFAPEADGDFRCLFWL